MITGLKKITSENPLSQIWKFLRFFLDPDFASERMRQIQEIPEGEHVANVKKQAKQIGYCIRQAEEHFQSSSQVGLATRPILLYYGAVSLSQALVLLKRDGTYSFDMLRKKGKRIDHGLKLVRGLAANVRPSKGPEAFFSSLQCDCPTNTISSEPSERNTPLGHFSLFYQALVPSVIQKHVKIRDSRKDMFLESDEPLNCADVLPLDSLINNRFNSLAILKTLPDMYLILGKLNIKAELCPGNLKVEVVMSYKKNDEGKEELDKGHTKYDFFIDSILPDQKRSFVSLFKERNSKIQLEAEFKRNVHFKYIVEHCPPHSARKTYLPDIVEDISGRKFYILRPDTYLPEPAAHLVLLYCLGIVSRYYPDIWMRAIDENVQIAELTDSLLNIIYRKFPNLILDQMTSTKHDVRLG